MAASGSSAAAGGRDDAASRTTASVRVSAGMAAIARTASDDHVRGESDCRTSRLGFSGVCHGGSVTGRGAVPVIASAAAIAMDGDTAAAFGTSREAEPGLGVNAAVRAATASDAVGDSAGTLSAGSAAGCAGPDEATARCGTKLLADPGLTGAEVPCTSSGDCGPNPADAAAGTLDICDPERPEGWDSTGETDPVSAPTTAAGRTPIDPDLKPTTASRPPSAAGSWALGLVVSAGNDEVEAGGEDRGPVPEAVSAIETEASADASVAPVVGRFCWASCSNRSKGATMAGRKGTL